MTLTIRGNTTIRSAITLKGFTGPILKFDAMSYTSGTTWLDTSGHRTSVTYSYFNTPSDFGFGAIKVVGDGAGHSYLAWSGPPLAWMETLQAGDTVVCDSLAKVTITGAKTTYSGPNTNASGWACYPISLDLEGGTSNDTNIGTIVITSSPSHATLHGDITIFDGASARFFTLTGTGGAEEGYAQVTPGVYFNHSFTAEGWVYVASVTNWARFFDFGNAGSDEVLIAVSEADTGYPVFSVSGENIVSPYALPIGEWVHLSGTYNYATKTGILYMNGTQVVTQVNMAQATQNTYRNQCYIGKSNWGADSNLEGAVGELAIYPFAMSGTEVLAQYNTRKTHYGL
jgi:hypothetical protein